MASASSASGAAGWPMEKLTASNYQMWKIKMKLMLVKDDLWDVVNPKPDPAPATWEKRSQRAQALIALSLDDDQLVHVVAKNSAWETWEALRKLHERPSLSSRLF